MWARWVPMVLTMAAISGASSQQSWPEALTGSPDWVLHGSAFGLLAASVWFGCGGALWPPRGRPRWALAAFLVAVLYGALDEWHQSFIPGRHASVLDWIADGVGAAIVAIGLAVAAFAGSRGVWENRDS